MSCLRDVQTISKRAHILPMPSLTRRTTGGALNPPTNTTKSGRNKLRHQEPLQPPREPRRLATTNSVTKNRCNHHENLEDRGHGHDADNARAGGHQDAGHGVRAVAQLLDHSLHAHVSEATRAPYRSARETPSDARHQPIRPHPPSTGTTIARHTGLPPTLIRQCSHGKRRESTTYNAPHFLNNS